MFDVLRFGCLCFVDGLMLCCGILSLLVFGLFVLLWFGVVVFRLFSFTVRWFRCFACWFVCIYVFQLVFEGWLCLKRFDRFIDLFSSVTLIFACFNDLFCDWFLVFLEFLWDVGMCWLRCLWGVFYLGEWVTDFVFDCSSRSQVWLMFWDLFAGIVLVFPCYRVLMYLFWLFLICLFFIGYCVALWLLSFACWLWFNWFGC